MIRINDDYVIDVDSMNYTAKRDLHTQSKDSKSGGMRDNYYTIGYYTSLQGAIKGIRNDMISKSLSDGEKSLEDALTAIREADEYFTEILQKARVDE